MAAVSDATITGVLTTTCTTTTTQPLGHTDQPPFFLAQELLHK